MTTSDLIAFAYQIAVGMEFLHFKKVSDTDLSKTENNAKNTELANSVSPSNQTDQPQENYNRQFLKLKSVIIELLEEI